MKENQCLPYMMFTVGDALLIASVDSIRYIGALPNSITDIPHAPECIRGFCDYEGDSVTMVDLCALLFGYRAASEKYFFTVEKYGFIVSEVLGIEAAAEFELSDNSSDSGNIRAVYTMSEPMYEKYRARTKSNAVFEPNLNKLVKIVRALR